MLLYMGTTVDLGICPILSPLCRNRKKQKGEQRPMDFFTRKTKSIANENMPHLSPLCRNRKKKKKKKKTEGRTEAHGNYTKIKNKSIANENRSSLLILTSRKHTHVTPTPPFKPHLHIVKLGFTGVYIIYPICARKHRPRGTR